MYFFLVLFLQASFSFAAEELVFWNFWNPKFILPVIEKFEKENPGVKIHNEQINWGNGLDKIIVAMANGRAPDICEIGSTWMGKFMSEGALLDVTDKFSDLKKEYLMWEPAQMGGRLYGMPWLAGTRVLFYNRSLFKSAGLNPDNPPKTWSEMLTAAKKIHNPADGTFGFGMNAGEGHILYKKFLPFVWGNHGKILDENGNYVFDSPQTREAFTYYLELQKYSYREKQDLLDEAFKRGKLGMTISGSWNFARYPKDAPDLDFSVALIPEPDNGKGYSASFMGGEILVLFKTCKNPDIAASFIRFLTRKENTLPITKEALVSFPANIEAFADPFFDSDPRLRVFIEQMKTGVHPPIHPLWIELEKIVNEAVEKAMYGTEIPVALGMAEKEYNRVKELRESRQKRTKADSIAAANDKANGKTSSSGWHLTLLIVIACGTILNAVLLSFLIIEVKKKRSLANGTARKVGPIERSQRALLFLSPWIITFLVFWLYPLLFSLILSFGDYDVFHPQNFRFTGLENYIRLFKDPQFVRAFKNTLFFVMGTTPVTTVLALALAVMINNLKKAEGFFRSAFFLPSIISIVVTATIFKSFYSPVGMLNRVLGFFGLTGYSWLVETSTALPAIMLMDIWAFLGYYMVLYLAAIKAVPKQYYEAADVDGATEWQKFRFITLPQIHYMTVFIIVINTIRSWQVFPEVFTLTRGGPLGSTDTMVHRLYEAAFRFQEMGYASALSYVLFAIILTLSLLQMRVLGRTR